MGAQLEINICPYSFFFPEEGGGLLPENIKTITKLRIASVKLKVKHHYTLAGGNILTNFQEGTITTCFQTLKEVYMNSLEILPKQIDPKEINLEKCTYKGEGDKGPVHILTKGTTGYLYNGTLIE